MSQPQPVPLFCGIDVSASTLACAILPCGQPTLERTFANTAAGHRDLIAWLGRHGATARVSLESTGIYSMDLALTLDRAPGVEIAVLNPKTVHRFASSLRRSKTDQADALALAEYSRRMPFTPWRAPGPAQLQLRSLTRHLDGLTEERTRLLNRLHAVQASTHTPRCLRDDLKRSVAALEKRIARLRRHALDLVQADPELGPRLHLLLTIPGIAQISALQLLGELTLLSTAMTVRQWVAHSGLDPAHQLSGSSIHKPSRISRAGNRHLRRSLFMPALVAARRDPHLKTFYQSLLARHKATMQALIAVARKLLHAIYGVLKTHTPYRGHALFPKQQLHTS